MDKRHSESFLSSYLRQQKKMSANNNTPDDDLLKRLRLGDEVAFTEIYNRFWEKLLAIGYYHTQDKQAAQDIVHEVFMSLWIRKAEVNIQSLEAYLATAVKFSVFKAIARDKKRKSLAAAQSIHESFTDIEEKLDARFLQVYLQGAVEKLPEKARLVFTYSRQHELPIIEIANKMDLSPKAIEYHMTKALRTLRNTLNKIKSFFI